MATASAILKDLQAIFIKLFYGKYDENSSFKEAIDDNMIDIEPYLKKLNGLLNNKEFIAGKITWLDFAIADFIQTLDILDNAIIKPYPNLTEH